MTEILAANVPLLGHNVANLGLRPHNLAPAEVDTRVAMAAGELALFVIKPGFYPNHPLDGAPIQTYAEGLLTAVGLDVLCTAERPLSALEVCELYRVVLPPNPEDDEKWGTDWKHDLIQYLSGDTPFSYLLEGEDAFNKAYSIKDFLRKHYAVDPNTQVVKNVGHVPDPPDFDISLQILFKDGLSYNSLEESKVE